VAAAAGAPTPPHTDLPLLLRQPPPGSGLPPAMLETLRQVNGISQRIPRVPTPGAEGDEPIMSLRQHAQLHAQLRALQALRDGNPLPTELVHQVRRACAFCTLSAAVVACFHPPRCLSACTGADCTRRLHSSSPSTSTAPPLPTAGAPRRCPPRFSRGTARSARTPPAWWRSRSPASWRRFKTRRCCCLPWPSARSSRAPPPSRCRTSPPSATASSSSR
jgi:hypothetical protein